MASRRRDSGTFSGSEEERERLSSSAVADPALQRSASSSGGPRQAYHNLGLGSGRAAAVSVSTVSAPVEIPSAGQERQLSQPGQRAPSHIDFNLPPQTGTESPAQVAVAVLGGEKPNNNSGDSEHDDSEHEDSNSSSGGSNPDVLASRWFTAIKEGKLIPIESMLKEYPVVMSFRNPKPTPFHPILGDSPSSVLGTDTRGMDGLQVAIMEYKTAYASWKISNVSGNAASTDRLRESIDVREAILGEMLCAVSAHHLDTHRFGYFQNTTLHLAAFYEDASLIGRLIMQNPDPFIRNGMGLLPIDATYSDPVRQVLETYMNRYHQQQRRRPNPGQQQQQPRRQQQQQHDPNLDLAAYYAQQQIDSQQASYFYNSQLAAHHAEVSSHSSDEENSISSGSHNVGHDSNRCKPMHTEGPIHRQLGRAAARQDSIPATAISEPSAEEDASGSGRDYSYHLQSIPSRLSTLIEVSCEDEVSSISDILSDHGTMHAGHRRNSILSGPSMDPISEIAEAAIENDPYINHTSDGGRSNVGRSSSTSNLQQQHQAQGRSLFMQHQSRLGSARSLGTISTTASGTSTAYYSASGGASDVTTGGESEFYSCNESNGYQSATAVVTTTTTAAPAATATNPTATEVEMKVPAVTTEANPSSDIQPRRSDEGTPAQDDQQSQFSTIRTQASSVSTIESDISSQAFGAGVRRKHRSNANSIADDDIDCSGIDDIFSDTQSDEGGGGVFTRSAGTLTFYSSQGLSEQPHSTVIERRVVAAQLEPVIENPTEGALSQAKVPRHDDSGDGGEDKGSNGSDGDSRLGHNQQHSRDVDYNKGRGSDAARLMVFSPDLYNVIMSNAPTSVADTACTPRQAAAFPLEQGGGMTTAVSKSDSPRIGRKQGRQAADYLAKQSRTLESSQAAHAMSNHSSPIPGEEEVGDSEFDWTIRGGISAPNIPLPTAPTPATGADDGVSRSSTMSTDRSLHVGSIDISQELLSIPLTVDSRDAIVESLIHKFGKASERRLGRIVDYELRQRGRSPSLAQTEGRHEEDDNPSGSDSTSTESSVKRVLESIIPRTVSSGSLSLRRRHSKSVDAPATRDGGGDRPPRPSFIAENTTNESGNQERQDTSGTEGDIEDNPPSGAADPCRRERRRSGRRSLSLSQERPLADAHRVEGEGDRPLTADTTKAASSPTPRKVSPLLKRLQERAYVSSAFGKSPTSDSAAGDAGAWGRPMSMYSLDFGTGGELSASSNHTPAAVSIVNHSSNNSNPVGQGRLLIPGTQVGRVKAFKEKFEQHGAASMARPQVIRTRANRAMSVLSSPSKSPGASPVSLRSQLSAAPATLTNTSDNRPNSVLSGSINGTPDAKKQATAGQQQSPSPIVCDPSDGGDSRGSSPSSTTSASSAFSPSTTSISHESASRSDAAANAGSSSDHSLPPHHRSPAERARRRQSNTLKVIQNSGLVRDRLLQLYTASAPSQLLSASKHNQTEDPARRGKQYLEGELGIDFSAYAASPTPKEMVKIEPKGIERVKSMSSEADSLCTSPLPTRSSVDLAELVEAASRAQGERSIVAPQLIDQVVASATPTPFDATGDGAPQQVVTVSPETPASSMDMESYDGDSSTPEYYRLLRKQGIDNPAEYVRSRPLKWIGASPAMSSPSSDNISSGSSSNISSSSLRESPMPAPGSDVAKHTTSVEVNHASPSAGPSTSLPAVGKGKEADNGTGSGGSLNDGPLLSQGTVAGGPLREAASDQASDSAEDTENIAPNTTNHISVVALAAGDGPAISTDPATDTPAGSTKGTLKMQQRVSTPFDPKVVFSLSSSNDTVNQDSSANSREPVRASRYISQQRAHRSATLGNDPAADDVHSSVSSIYLLPFEEPTSGPATPYTTIRSSTVLAPSVISTIPGVHNEVEYELELERQNDSRYSSIKAIPYEPTAGPTRIQKSTQPFRRQANPWQQQQGGSDNESDEDIALSSRGALTSDNLREGFDKPSDTSLKRYVYSVATTPGPEPATPYFGGKTQQPQPLPLPPPPSLPPSLDDFAYDSTTMTQGTGGEQPPADVDTTDLTPSHQASASYHSQGNQAYAPPAVTDNNNNNHLQQQQQYVHHLEMQVSGSDTSLISGSSSTSNADAPLTPETPKDGEPLQQYLFQSITFSEEMTKSLRHIEEKASRAKHGIISVHEIGQVKQLAAEAASTAIDRGDTEDRPTTALPPYITPINELPQNGLFVLPPPKVTLGNLYLKIICMDKIQLSREVLQNVESFYFVIRNGLNKHVCDLFPANISAVGGRDNPDEVVIHINQQFRIAVNPLQSVTLHLRMRYRPGYIPPRLRSMDQQQQQPKSGLASDEKRAPKPKKLTRPTGSCPPPFNLFNLAFSKGVSPANSIIADAANSSIASIASNHGCLPRLGRLMRKNTRSSNHSMSSGESAEITTTFDYRHNYSDQITVHNANERRRANTAPSMPPAPPQQQATDPGSTRKVVDSLSPVDAIHYNDQAFPPNPSRHDGRSLWYPASEIFTPIMVQIQPNEPASRIPVHHVGKVYEETIGVASVYVESMIDEVYLRTLTDTWDVEYVYGKEGITICRLHFQLFFIPISPELYLDDLPRSIDECADDMWIHFWHSSVYTNGFLSQCGGDTSFWRRRYYKLIGAYLVVYSENTRNVRVLIDLSMATKIADNSLALPPTAGSGEAGGPAEARMLANGITPLDRPRKAPPGVGSFLFNPPPPGVKRRMTKHGVSRADAQHRKRNAASPQPPGMLPIQPILMQGSQGGLSSQSANSSDHDIAFINTSLQSIYGNVSYSFSVQFGHSGWIEFYADTAEEQRKWVRAITKVMEGIPELPTWILKMARAECAGAFPAPLMNVASSK